ncbi:DUF6668 family protein [Nocardiopsis dassonvillei]|uniref:DUF6668 family protein n=1 Tax=Nocardiopsis dassonvillei TaxID=2014 RepID=UPI0036720228
MPGPALMWWLGVHGGAGERTMAALIQDSRTVGHAWPVVATPNVPAPRVVLVARTHARGLLALQAAATEWASGQTGVDLLGAVLIADAPGRLPRPLRDLMSLVSGGVPRTWHVPWMEPWRRGETVTATDVPKPVRTLVTEISDLLK